MKRKNDDEKKEVVALLSARCKDLGLTAMAKLLGVDAANLAKVIAGKRPASQFLMIKIRRSGITLAE
jgi:plasmid maintenance system antidote protein VapI